MKSLQRTSTKKTGTNIPNEGAARKCGSCGQTKFGCKYEEREKQWLCLTCEDLIQNKVTELLKFAPLVEQIEENNSIVLDEKELKGLQADGLPTNWYIYLAFRIEGVSRTARNISIPKFCQRWQVTTEDMLTAAAFLSKKGIIRLNLEKLNTQVFTHAQRVASIESSINEALNK